MPDEQVKLSEGYDWRVSLRKAGVDLGKAVLVAAATAVGMWLSDPVHTAEAAKAAGPYALLALPLLLGAGRFVTNWAKNKDR